MTPRLAPGLLAAAAGLTVAAAGCGGSSPKPPANASPGLRVFDQANCGSCHTLTAAHAKGKVGKNLDGAKLDAATVEQFVRTGGGGMPSFKDQLTNVQIQQVAEYVSQSSQ